MKIILTGKQKFFFFSDPHFGHSNICRGTSNWDITKTRTRDFQTLEEMNEKILSNINDVVGLDDILFCLGDFSFGQIENVEYFRNRIQCKNLHLIFGNHDHFIKRNKENTQRHFSSVNDYLELQINNPEGNETKKYKFVLFHFPIASWDGMKRGCYSSTWSLPLRIRTQIFWWQNNGCWIRW